MKRCVGGSDDDDVDGDEKQLRIKSQPWGDFKEKSLEIAEDFDEGVNQSGPDVLSFDTAEDVTRILTAKRLELLHKVMDAQVPSIRQLAKELDRNVSDVHGDVELLKEYGIIELRKEGRSKRPVVPYDEISIEVSLEVGDSDDDRRKASV